MPRAGPGRSRPQRGFARPRLADPLVLGHRDHVAEVVLFQEAPELEVQAVGFIGRYPGGRYARLQSAGEHIRASTGLVANCTSSLMPAWSHRARSSVQDFGRYSSASISARPDGEP